jgi:hypothetical protein
MRPRLARLGSREFLRRYADYGGGGGGGAGSPPDFLFTLAGTLGTDQNGNIPVIRATRSGTFPIFDAKVVTAPTGAAVVVNFRKNGLIVATVIIAVGTTYASSATPVPFVDADVFSAEVVQVGSVIPGVTLTARARAS